MVDENALTDDGTGVDLNPRTPARKVRDEAPEPLEAMVPAPVRPAVQDQGMQARVAGEHFPGAAGGRRHRVAHGGAHRDLVGALRARHPARGAPRRRARGRRSRRGGRASCRCHIGRDTGRAGSRCRRRAAHLGISPGNLYYHFRNKEDIVHQIFLEYQQFVRQRLTLADGRQPEVADVLGYLDTAFDGMWRYRFMFYDLPGLLARNPALQHDYQRFIDDELTDTLHGLFVRCADAGLFAIDAADIRPLVINIWLVVKFWYAFEQASHPSQPISEATGRRGVRQVLALLKPYVTATLRPAFIAACARYGEA